MHRTRPCTFIALPLACAALAAAIPATVVAQQHTVNRVVVAARPASFAGRCPAHLHFVGTIYVTRYPVWLEYEWERSDGGRGPRQRVEVRSRSLTVGDSWELGGGRERLRVWERLHVLAPTGISSPAANVSVNCR